MKTFVLTLTVNGEQVSAQVPTHYTLLRALREVFDYTDVKDGCSKGDCGACTVILDGKAVNSCMVLAFQAQGAEVITVRGLGTPENLHPIQRAMVEMGGVQCGYCTPGMVLSAKALLDANPHPTRDEIRVAISGNLCRCTGYKKIVDAIEAVAAGRYS